MQESSCPACEGRGARSVFITAVLLLVAAGTVMVFSASAFHWSVQGDSYYFLRKQILWLPVAFLGFGVFANLSPQVLRKYYWHLLAVGAVLLAVVLIPQIGRNVNASRRWLPIGAGLQFQPSELAKLAVVIFVAGYMSARPERSRQFFRGFLAICAAVLPVFLLILVEPDFGTAVFVLVLAFCVLYLSGTRTIFFLASALIFAPLIALFVYHRWELVQVRLLGFIDPDGLYQVRQSLTALGSGGWWGQGLGASGQKLRFLPEPHTDFILAIVGEELGFFGCVAVLSLFALLLWSGVLMVRRFRDLFSFLVGSGIVISLAFQAILNVAVVTASAPTKGIPLPLISFGGSGLCVALLQVGILLSLERENRLSATTTVAPGEASEPSSPPGEGRPGAEEPLEVPA